MKYILSPDQYVQFKFSPNAQHNTTQHKTENKTYLTLIILASQTQFLRGNNNFFYECSLFFKLSRFQNINEL